MVFVEQLVAPITNNITHTHTHTDYAVDRQIVSTVSTLVGISPILDWHIFLHLSHGQAPVLWDEKLPFRTARLCSRAATRASSKSSVAS